MKKRVYIIHGWGAGPKENWFGWLRRELEQEALTVEAPEMPNPFLPKKEQWVAKLNEVIGEPDGNVFLVGHSLGVITILRYLESLAPGQKIGGAVLVSGFAESIHIPVLENFTDGEVDFAKIKSACPKFAVFHSDNDPVVPLQRAFTLHEKLHAKLVIIDQMGHLDEGSGNCEFPELLVELDEIAG